MMEVFGAGQGTHWGAMGRRARTLRWYLVSSLTVGASAVLSWENHSMRDLIADMVTRDGLNNRMGCERGFASLGERCGLYMGPSMGQKSWRRKSSCRS